MRKALWLFIRVVCTAGFLSACTQARVAPEPVAVEHLDTLPATWSVWWQRVNACAGVAKAPELETVVLRAYIVDAPFIHMNGRTQTAIFTGDEIYVARDYVNDYRVIGHELMHAALYKLRGHPVGHENQYFGPGNVCNLSVSYTNIVR